MAGEVEELKRPETLGKYEARELGRLIQEDITAEEESRKLVNRLKEAFRKIWQNKKALYLALSALVVVSIGLAFYLVPGEKVIPDKNKAEETLPDTDPALPEKPVVYELQPFFLPLLNKGKETGKFISVKAQLLLSNKLLEREVDRALPLIRQNIYAILKRKKESDFLSNKKQIKARVKKEILLSANTNLVSGIGNIEDVFFSEFLVR